MQYACLKEDELLTCRFMDATLNISYIAWNTPSLFQRGVIFLHRRRRTPTNNKVKAIPSHPVNKL